MSREGLIPQLLARGVQVVSLKWCQHSVSVYEGTFKNYMATIRVQTLASGVDSALLERESRMQISVSHENVAGLYDCFWERKGSRAFFIIVTEWCEKDLARDMKQREEIWSPWREVELWNLTSELVSALTYLQEQGISHRDINPENVLITARKTTKLVRVFLSDSHFAAPFYSSPKLREAFVTRNPEIVHDFFKSDVFSLGMTLLSLALLKPPLELAKANLSNEEVNTVINKMPYSDLFKEMLSWMLSVEEDHRCDFKMLHSWIAIEVYGQGNEATNCQTGKQEHISEDSKGNCNMEPLCLQCDYTVSRDSDLSKCEVVQLYCDPAKHMFCSRKCFRRYLSLGSAKCPLCGVDIPGETIAFYQLQPILAECLGDSYSSGVTFIKEDKSSSLTREFNICGELSSDQVPHMTTEPTRRERLKPRKELASVCTCCAETCSCW